LDPEGGSPKAALVVVLVVVVVISSLKIPRLSKFLNSFAQGTLARVLKRVVFKCSLHSLQTTHSLSDSLPLMVHSSGGSRKKYLGGLAPYHLGGNNG